MAVECTHCLTSLLIGLCQLQSIETDETAKKPDQVKMPLSSEEEREAITQLENAIATNSVTPGKQISNPQNSICAAANEYSGIMD